jgi:hypothetical protein
MWQHLFCLITACLFLSIDARITHASIAHDDRRAITLSRPFGFTAFGDPFLNITLKHAEIEQKDEDELSLNCFGFYLVQGSFNVLETEAGGKCAPEEANLGTSVRRIAGFDDEPFASWISKNEDDRKQSASWVLSDKQVMEGVHTLYFVNCCEDRALVTFKLRTEMYNLIGGNRTYLSVGELELPTLYLVRSDL